MRTHSIRTGTAKKKKKKDLEKPLNCLLFFPGATRWVELMKLAHKSQWIHSKAPQWHQKLLSRWLTGQKLHYYYYYYRDVVPAVQHRQEFSPTITHHWLTVTRHEIDGEMNEFFFNSSMGMKFVVRPSRLRPTRPFRNLDSHWQRESTWLPRFTVCLSRRWKACEGFTIKIMKPK